MDLIDSDLDQPDFQRRAWILGVEDSGDVRDFPLATG